MYFYNAGLKTWETSKLNFYSVLIWILTEAHEIHVKDVSKLSSVINSFSTTDRSSDFSDIDGLNLSKLQEKFFFN